MMLGSSTPRYFNDLARVVFRDYEFHQDDPGKMIESIILVTVPKAVVHAVFEGQGEVLEAAGGPVRRHLHGTGRTHDAAVLGTHAVLRVVLHSCNKNRSL